MVGRSSRTRWVATISVCLSHCLLSPIVKSLTRSETLLETMRFRKALLLLSLPPLSPSPFPSRDSRDIDDVLDLRLEAMEALVASVKLVPYNWSAWLKLATCLEGAEEVSLLRAPTFLGY